MIVNTGSAFLTNNQTQTISFGATLGSAPSRVLISFTVTAGGTAALITGDVVAGTITTTGFNITLFGAPGNTTDKIDWIAIG